MQGPARVVVGIATHNRPAILAETIAFLTHQKRKPDHIFVAYAEAADIANAADLANAPDLFPGITFLQAPLGLTRQRNAILAAALQYDFLLFIDDDFYLEPQYISVTERFLREHPEVAACTGRVLADDVKGPGLTVQQAKAILANSDGPEQAQQITPVFLTYGCNMCLRLAPVRDHQLRFDEVLPLYGWYEDWDFSRQLAAFGSLVHISNACGVHLSTKAGRIPGIRLGYSQIANPIYLARKGTFPWLQVFRFTVGPCLKNLVRSFYPESHVDRAGRFWGNLAAVRDLCTGTLRPEQILDL